MTRMSRVNESSLVTRMSLVYTETLNATFCDVMRVTSTLLEHWWMTVTLALRSAARLVRGILTSECCTENAGVLAWRKEQEAFEACEGGPPTPSEPISQSPVFLSLSPALSVLVLRSFSVSQALSFSVSGSLSLRVSWSLSLSVSKNQFQWRI